MAHSATWRPRVALVWHEIEDGPKARRARLDGVFRALTALGADAEAVVYADESAGAARDRLLRMHGVLVWVNPITSGRDRTVLDGVLREVAAAGVWVSAHPDVVRTLGTKEVLYRTRDLGWGSDVRLHEDAASLRSALVGRLASGPLVLKRARGNAGIGVWKIELASTGSPTPTTVTSRVRVLHAYDGASEVLEIDGLVERFASYLEDGGRLVEQPFLPRVQEGMVRCYLSGAEVVGFAEHLPKGFVSQQPGSDATEAAEPASFDKVMHGPAAQHFRSLREVLESEWIPAMRRTLEIDEGSLPAIWDADFLRGDARIPAGEEAWVLCEINASCVSPFPDSAAEAIARTTLARLEARRT